MQSMIQLVLLSLSHSKNTTLYLYETAILTRRLADTMKDSNLEKSVHLNSFIRMSMDYLGLKDDFMDDIVVDKDLQLLEMIGQAYLLICNCKVDDEIAMDAYDKGLLVLEGVLAQCPDNHGLSEQLKCMNTE